MKFYITNFLSKCDQIHNFLQCKDDTLMRSTKKEQFCDFLYSFIHKNEHYIYRLKTIESANKWEYLAPLPLFYVDVINVWSITSLSKIIFESISLYIYIYWLKLVHKDLGAMCFFFAICMNTSTCEMFVWYSFRTFKFSKRWQL